MLPRFSFASSILQPKHQPIYKSISISGPFQSEQKSRNLFSVTSQPAPVHKFLFPHNSKLLPWKEFLWKIPQQFNYLPVCPFFHAFFFPVWVFYHFFNWFTTDESTGWVKLEGEWVRSENDSNPRSPTRSWLITGHLWKCFCPPSTLLTTKSPERKPRGSLKEIYTSIINRKCTAYLFLITFPCNDDDDNPM